MNNVRCMICGSSRLDPEAYKCGRCGGAIGLRNEACYVSNETKKKLLEHAAELPKFGIRLEMGLSRPLRKDVLANLALDVVLVILGFAEVVDRVRPGTLRELVLYLRELAIPETDILALRLGEPEEILKYCRMDKKQGDAVIKWTSPKRNQALNPDVPSSTLPKQHPRKSARRGSRRKTKRH